MMIIFTVTEKIDPTGSKTLGKIKRRLMLVQKWMELLYFKSESAISTIG